MDLFACILNIVALLVQTQWTHGSEIIFEKNPSKIDAVLSTPLHMRCALHDSDTSHAITSGLVGRSANQTPTDIEYVTSLVILRNGVDVAAVSQFTPAKAHADFEQLVVSGQITGRAGERAYLQLTWTNPGISQSGNYTCEVNGVIGVGHVVTIHKETAMLMKNTPTLDDLVRHIHDQDVTIQKQGIIINKIINDTYDKIRDLETEWQRTMQSKIDLLSSDMQSKIEQLTSARNTTNHMENGTIDCGDSTRWTHTDGRLIYNVVSHQFNASYSKIPIVRWSISDYNFDHDTNYMEIMYHINVIETTTQGFTMKCVTRKSSGYRTNELKLHWTSFPQY